MSEQGTVSNASDSTGQCFAILTDFYEFLSQSSFLFASSGTRGLLGIDSYLYSSMVASLNASITLARDGQLGDAYALLRRYYDLVVINGYSCLYLDDHVGPDCLIVEQIDAWVRGDKKLPPFRKMIAYMRSAPQLKVVADLLFDDTQYRGVRGRCNDFIHYNAYAHAMANDGALFLQGREKARRLFEADLQDLFILHFAILLCVRPHYLASSDYVDSLECEMTPEEGSQYWIAPVVQQAFDQLLKSKRPDVSDVLLAATNMQLS